MTEQVLELLTVYGLPAAALVLAIGQLGFPLPTSLALLMLGALAANGDADIAQAFLWATAGVLAGDQLGYLIGWAIARSAEDRKGALGALAQKAAATRPFIDRWGSSGVFLSRWLFTALGPAINVAAGIARMNWSVFTLWSVAGELLWVSIYIALGHSFGSNIETLGGILGNMSMALALLALAAWLGWLLLKTIRKARARHDPTGKDDRNV
ncbi:DedA family protein [Hoeflea olei]|uniref:VTT domain-containing protein n=1 Tax=Hoeflea olei TaxID=1480615 RepID=A0A1C1YYZ3_9HYPH|nr:VTT domain-containing protein [Hoeflea olei]OCW58753.1 hypothetical protein AWJ14_00565 [Hoeflea olei]